MKNKGLSKIVTRNKVNVTTRKSVLFKCGKQVSKELFSSHECRRNCLIFTVIFHFHIWLSIHPQLSEKEASGILDSNEF